MLLIAFLQIGKGWLKFPWTLVVNEIIGKQMRKIMPVFISTPLLNLPKQKLFFYGLYYFSRPSQMIKWDPGKVTLIIREYKTYYIWAAFTSSLHYSTPLSHWLNKHPQNPPQQKVLEFILIIQGQRARMLETWQGHSGVFRNR